MNSSFASACPGSAKKQQIAAVSGSKPAAGKSIFYLRLKKRDFMGIMKKLSEAIWMDY